MNNYITNSYKFKYLVDRCNTTREPHIAWRKLTAGYLRMLRLESAVRKDGTDFMIFNKSIFNNKFMSIP